MNPELFTQQLDKALAEKDDKVLRMRVEILRDFVAEMGKTNIRFTQPVSSAQATSLGPQPSQLAPTDLQGGKSPTGPGALVGGDDLVKYTRPKGA